MYCPQPKVDNSNRLYHFSAAHAKIIGYPTRDVIETPAKIKGISIGASHCLCWDHNGYLYSWGSKSLGLGYTQLPTDVWFLLLRNSSNSPDQSKSIRRF